MPKGLGGQFSTNSGPWINALSVRKRPFGKKKMPRASAEAPQASSIGGGMKGDTDEHGQTNIDDNFSYFTIFYSTY